MMLLATCSKMKKILIKKNNDNASSEVNTIISYATRAIKSKINEMKEILTKESGTK